MEFSDIQSHEIPPAYLMAMVGDVYLEFPRPDHLAFIMVDRFWWGVPTDKISDVFTLEYE